jgi:hypothetical protein
MSPFEPGAQKQLSTQTSCCPAGQAKAVAVAEAPKENHSNAERQS